jgi:hypothetical protein
LSKEEFWSLTPGEFWAMKYRLDVRFRQECFVAGIVAADYRNAHGGKDGSGNKPYSPLDYVSCEEMTAEEIAAEQKEQNEQAVEALRSMGAKEKVSK